MMTGVVQYRRRVDNDTRYQSVVIEVDEEDVLSDFAQIVPVCSQIRCAA